MGNFIIVPRTIFENGTFGREEPFTKREAFLDLVQMAAFEDTDSFVSGCKYRVCRGQLAISKSFLARRWGWSIDKVRRYLDYLKRNGWCDCVCDNRCGQPITLISIARYDSYQGIETTAEAAPDTADAKDNNKKRDDGTPPSVADSVERIYALYPSSAKRPDGKTVTLRSSKKNKAHIMRMLSSGEYTEESLSYAIRRYLEETNPPYLKLFETFLNQVPDYSQTEPVREETQSRAEAMRKALNPTKEEVDGFYRRTFSPQHPPLDGEDKNAYWQRVRDVWESERKAWIARRVDAVNNKY